MMNIETTGGLVLSAGTLKGDKIVDGMGETLGTLEELMIDVNRGRIAYAVLSVGGFLGMGDKLFAIPWSAIHVDTAAKHLVLDVKKELLESAAGFDKDHWPDFADQAWGTSVHSHFGSKPFWE